MNPDAGEANGKSANWLATALLIGVKLCWKELWK
jgi:hypothetical protein